jgi:hypothetical protein
MQRILSIVMLITLVVGVPFTGGATGTENDGVEMGFGFGGAMLGLFLPELTAINDFLNGGGFAPLDGVLLTAGGGGRGGVINGLSIGGIGWGGVDVSLQNSRKATLGAGFGGLEIGYAMGGNERSVLTLGGVIGAGGSDLKLWWLEPEDDDTCPGAVKGIAPVLTDWTFRRGFVAVEPFISMHVQPCCWMGFELRLGYLLPLVGIDWACSDVNVSSPSLNLSGPVVGFSLTFGGIGTAEPGYAYSEVIEKTIDLTGKTTVSLENPAGSITIEAEDGGSVQTRANRVVELVAVKRAKTETALASLAIEIGETDTGIEIRSVHRRGNASRRVVDYVLTVPVGVDLEIEQAAGDTVLRGAYDTVSLELGAGSITVENLSAGSLSVDLGAGDLTLLDIESDLVEADVGVGSIDVMLSTDASYTFDASIGVGDLSVSGFPNVQVEREGFIGYTARGVVGMGIGILSLDVGVGEIAVGWMRE